MLNTLFLGAGRQVELLRAFRRAYRALQLDGQIVAADVDRLAPALHFSDRPAILPPREHPDFLPSLLALCRREQVGLLFPLVPADVPLLARHRAEIEASGTRVAAVSAPAAAIAADPQQTHRFFQRLGLPVGAQDSPPGPEIVSDLVCDLDGAVLAVVSRQEIECQGADVVRAVTLGNPALVEACCAIARALPALGPLAVRSTLRDGTAHFTAIEPVMNPGLPLSIAAGADAPRWLLARVAGLEVEVPPLGDYQHGLWLSRYPDSLILDESRLQDLTEDRL